jgi:hypothetical protein
VCHFDGLRCGVTRTQILVFLFPMVWFVRDVPFSLLEMMEELCVVRRASALHQLTPLVRPVHTNCYAYMIHAHERGVVTLSDIPAALSCHVIRRRCSVRNSSPFTSAEAPDLGTNSPRNPSFSATLLPGFFVCLIQHFGSNYQAQSTLLSMIHPTLPEACQRRKQRLPTRDKVFES